MASIDVRKSPSIEVKEDSPSSKIKRSKTFTGCFTCRSRKIRCDLTTPACKKCTRAGLICAGYDIKLRWSLPIEFNSKNGSAISKSVVFKRKQATNDSDEEEQGNADYFQRRHVGFVTWDEKKNCKPYETYEEMDRDLGILHNSGNDRLVNQAGKTKLLGPFGVFKGSKAKMKKQTDSSDKKATKRENDNPDKDAVKRVKPTIPARYVDASSSSHNNTINYAVPINKPPLSTSVSTTPSSISGYDNTAPHDQFWLSTELRDDAMLTAAALDNQFLDLMNNFTPGSALPSGVVTPRHKSNYNAAFNFNNPNDILNLVFHRTHNFNAPPHVNAQHPTQSAIPASNMLNMSAASNTAIDPTNQHLYYSNYNNYYYNNPYSSNETLQIHLHASMQNDEEDSTDLVEGDHQNATRMPASIMNIVESPLKLGIDLSLPSNSSKSPKVDIPTTALQIQPLTRYLLNYYVNEVADLMTVIPLTENPWKAIYFPRALMAIGELSALGKTSTAKNALLNALLAVSAFNLQSKFPKNSEPMKYYLNLGIALRNQASLFVKQLLNSKSDTQSGIEYCISHEKYKDVLCAVMTMISVDLVWGTMQDTGVYIAWCGKVILAKMANKKKLSSKARILHRIFSSMKLIQDSTCLDIESIKDDFESNLGSGYDVNGDKFGNTSAPVDKIGKARIDFIVNNTFSGKTTTKTASPSFVNKKLINTKKNDENFATDALYGLPNSLILLFSDTVELLRTKIYHKGTHKELPPNFKNRIEELNSKLLNWKLDWELFETENDDSNDLAEVDNDLDDVHMRNVEIELRKDAKKKFYSPMHEATYHHIMSFYHALVIYFARLIKEMPPDKLQTKVAKTLNHLNSIQKLIAKDEASMIPLFWQGFIAGCEAISINLQMGFKKWGADIAQYLGSYWGARQIMLEVWRRKRMNEPRDDWVSVVQDWEMNLMLN
ncbi:ARG81 [[Candida] subhashii]|uniref:ARG81 n=1 Tax=[Candida] subhashii TaxID=561895 RepID=A0A8J5QH49_9ASCO|nr:ARG81 [[Candida] subhashii]KAG7661989.1 ARG81 [[Candida] subhashii]